MKAQANKIGVAFNEIGLPLLTLHLTLKHDNDINELKSIIDNGKLLSVEVKQHRQKRSLDSNSYAWVMISKMANALFTTPDEVYISMLTKYGQREPQLLSVVSEGVEMIQRATNNHCTIVGVSELNGREFTHIAILRGSSTFDSKEMSLLIGGIVSDCKELNIETMSPDELKLLNEEWGNRG